jgi:MFS transporter, ACS family, glucarate transporter
MVLVAAGIFTLIDCTKGFDHKVAPGNDPVAA